MGIYDITRPLLPGMVVYPGDIDPSFILQDHGRYLITGLHMSSHSGTHIDAPSHYMRDDRTVDRIPFHHLIGSCRVIDLTAGPQEIGAGDLAVRIGGATRVLVKTAFSGKDYFYPEYPAFLPEAATMVAGSGITCIGIDSPSIESFQGDGSVHKTLLSRGIMIIELLDLSAVQQGDYFLVALPLRLEGSDGSPARVLLSDCVLPGVSG